MRVLDPDLAFDTDELVDFPWPVSDLGYVVKAIDRRDVAWTNSDLPGLGSLPAGSRYETPADMGDEEWPEPVEVLVRRADVDGRDDAGRWGLPLRAEPRSRPAFFAFAKVSDSDRVMAFAKRHGMLGKGHQVVMPDGRHVPGELVRGWGSARGWIDEAAALRECASVYLHASGGGTADPEWVDEAQQRRVHSIIRARLREDVTADLLRHEGTGQSVLRLRPRTLLGALWLQLAQAIDRRARFRACPGCRSWFAVGLGAGEGARRRRSDAQHCSVACRTAHHNRDRTEARRMAKSGASDVRIAQKLERDVEWVKKWRGDSNG